VLLAMTLIMALIEMLGVASILPFIAVLTNPEIVETNTILNTRFIKSGKNFGIDTKQQFLFALGIFVFLLLITSISFKALTIYFQTQFIKCVNIISLYV
jgi:hypothetical protein